MFNIDKDGRHPFIKKALSFDGSPFREYRDYSPEAGPGPSPSPSPSPSPGGGGGGKGPDDREALLEWLRGKLPDKLGAGGKGGAGGAGGAGGKGGAPGAPGGYGPPPGMVFMMPPPPAPAGPDIRFGPFGPEIVHRGGGYGAPMMFGPPPMMYGMPYGMPYGYPPPGAPGGAGGDGGAGGAGGAGGDGSPGLSKDELLALIDEYYKAHPPKADTPPAPVPEPPKPTPEPPKPDLKYSEDDLAKRKAEIDKKYRDAVYWRDEADAKINGELDARDANRKAWKHYRNVAPMVSFGGAALGGLAGTKLYDWITGKTGITGAKPRTWGDWAIRTGAGALGAGLGLFAGHAVNKRFLEPREDLSRVAIP